MLALLALILMAVAVASAARGVAVSRLRADARLRQIDAYGYVGATPAAAPTGASQPGVALAIGSWLSPRVGSEREERLRRELLAAGLYTIEPRALTGYRVLATLLLGSLGVVADPLLISGPLLDTVVLGAAGWFLPLTYVRRRARLRLAEIDRGVPDLIDLLVVTIEAGSGFGHAVQQSATRTPGPLGAELRLLLQEQRFGLSPEESLEHLLGRADTPNVRSFVRSVTQGEALGVSIGQIMRNLAHEMRLRRRQSAEERAQKAPVKMLFPLAFCVMPSLLIVVMAPPVLQIIQTLGS
ncbi:MAG TPA: type II secretion system F family protein [Baekduia sp.]|nr:type II secretion system F family protein [Baekduia sp.]